MATKTQDPEQEQNNQEQLLSNRVAKQEQEWRKDVPSEQIKGAKTESSQSLAEKEKTGGSNFSYSSGSGKSADKTTDSSGSTGDTIGGGNFNASKVYTKVLGSNKKKAGAAGLLAAFIASFVLLFMFSLPLKVLHIMNNLQNKFYASAENAVDKETDRLMSQYIKGKFKASCNGKFIDHTCNPYKVGDSLVTRLYRGWSDGKLEEKLLKQYGVAFALRDGGKTHVLEFFDDNGKLIDYQGLEAMLPEGSNLTIDDLMKSNTRWSPTTRQELRAHFRQAMEHETRYKRTMYRIKVGRLLERKYGIKRCVIGCKVKDRYADWKDDKKRAMKMYLSQRILSPRTAMYDYLVKCILQPDACSTSDFTDAKTNSDYTADATGCTKDCELNGEPTTKSDEDIRRDILIEKVLTAYGGDVDSLRKDYEDYKNGMNDRFTKKVKSLVDDSLGEQKGSAALGKLVDSAAFKGTKKAIPVVGWIDTAATLVAGEEMIKTAIPKMMYTMNATSTAQFFTMYRTVADETKQGNVDPEILGSFATALGPGIQIDATKDNQIGGTAEAENTPLYRSIIGNQQTNTEFAAKSDGLFGSKVLAATSDNTCKDTPTVPAGQLICPEEKVQQSSGVIDAMNKLFSGPLWNSIVSAANAWNAVSNGIAGLIGQALGFICGAINIPFTGININPTSIICDGVEQLAQKAMGAISPFLQAKLDEALKYIFTNIFGYSMDLISTTMSGGRAFDNLAAGADVSGNAFAQNGLGGTQLDASQVAQIAYEQEEQRYQDYKNESFFARIFDKESDYSLVSHVTMSMPQNKSLATRTYVAKLSNPLNLVSGLLNSIFSFSKVSAAPKLQVVDDPFGIAQYGFPTNDPTLTEADPDAFWTTYCTTTNDGSADPSAWSITKLYNSYAALTAQSNIDGAYGPVNSAPSMNGIKPDLIINGASAQAIVDAFSKKSPMGTNRCLLIQAAVGSAGAIFTDDVLSPDEQADSDATTSTVRTVSPANTGTNPGACVPGSAGC